MLARLLSFLSQAAGLCPELLTTSVAQIGSVDASFNGGTLLNVVASGSVRAQGITTNGQSIIAGDFTTVGGVARERIARLNAGGSLDATFGTGTGANGTIHAVGVRSDGTILIAVDFTQSDGVSRSRIARLTAMEVLDTSFNPGTGCNGTVYSITSYSTRSLSAASSPR